MLKASVVHLKYVVLFMAFGLAAPISLHAEEAPAANVISAPTGSSTYKSKKTATDDSGFKLGVDLKAITYSSSSDYDNGSLQQAEVEFGYKRRSGSFFTNTDLILGTFSTEESVYFALPEAYVGFGDKTLSITAGRKIENLSFADSFYNLGLIQGFATNDYINYFQGGLVGLAAHYNEGSFGFNLSYNPIFIPNQAPTVKIQDGKAFTTNRWAAVPPEQFRLGDQNRDIIYAISDYSVSDIVSNSGFMANVFIGEQNRPTAELTYGHLPLNDLVFQRDTFADIATFHGNVILTPMVGYHDIVSADLNLDAGNLKSTFSFIGDHPINKQAEGLQTMQTLEPLNILSAYFSYDFNKALGRKLELYVAAANIAGGDIKDLTSDGKVSDITYANSRTLFKRPVRFGAKGDLFFISGRALQVDMNLTYDQALKGSLLSAALKYNFTKSFNANLGLDMIGVEQENTSSAERSNFLDQYKANDRVSAGVGYVF